MRNYLLVLMFSIPVLTLINCETHEEYNLMPKLFHLDDFESCMDLGKNALYCSVTIQLAPVDAQNKSRVWNIIQEVIKNPKNYRHDWLRYGICVPTACPSIELTANNTEKLSDGISLCYSSKFQSLGLKASVTKIQCETDQPNHTIDNYDVAVGIFFGVLFGIVIAASFYEGLARYKPKEDYNRITNTPVGRIATCFSLPANWSRLKKYTSNTENPAFKGINGIRFFNTQLIIVGHAALMIISSPVRNPAFVENLTNDPEKMLLINGTCNVQTFFLIAGYLMSYKFLLFFEKHKQFQLKYLVLTFINRYIRLTPCLLVVMAFNGTWLYHISRGPMWERLVGEEYRNCRSNWWANALYFNNYYNVKNICMQQSWYLAADTQLFLASLVVVALMWKYQNRIQLILGASFATGVALASVINYYYNFDIVFRHYPENAYKMFLDVPEFVWGYMSSLTNFGGYTIGMLLGYLVYRKSKTHAKQFTKKIHLVLWWVLIWGTTLSVVYYGVFIYQDDYKSTRIGAAIYASLHKNLYAFGISLFIYGVTEGIGWFMRDCIHWSPVEILGRLTYCTYLVHTTVQRVRGGQTSTLMYMSNYSTFTNAASDTAVSYILGTLLSLFVELPTSALQKLIVPQISEDDSSNFIESQADGTVREIADKKEE